MDNQTIELYIYGRVQGVYYRKTIKKYAHKNNITGFVKNLPNGAVYIIAYGGKENLDIFRGLCKKGSLPSFVSHIDEKHIDEHNTSPYDEFFIIKGASFIKDQIYSFSQLFKNIMTNKQKVKNRVVPEHIAIIPNGNRTWAKKRNLNPWAGYWKTYKNLDSIIKAAEESGVPHVTIWGFSTENWKRNADETAELFKVVSLVLETLTNKLITEKIQFNHLGRKDRLPSDILKTMSDLETATATFTGKSINLALDYGGRDEIIRAVNTLLQSGKTAITEKEFSALLDTKNIPDPDLIIRTANEKRMSGMMPWQATYAEYYFTKKNFPAFTGKDLRKAIVDFGKRKRTFGGDINKNKQPT